MPLKHKQETWLIVLLALAILCAGITLATLPALPGGIAPWGVAFTISLVYPFMVYPVLRRNRADYEFRLLHWLPMGMLLLWLVLQLVGMFVQELSFLSLWIAWGWSLPLVLVGFFMLILFCLSVIRRWGMRIALLSMFFIPFVFFGILSEQASSEFNATIASVIWEPLVADHTFSDGETDRGIAILDGSSNGVSSLASSSDSGEEAWRSALRRFQEQMRAALRRSPEDAESPLASGDIDMHIPADEGMLPWQRLPDTLQPGGTGTYIRDVDSQPDQLPGSGFGWAAIILALIAGYCGVLHARARDVRVF
ncbi:MAG: hypothetical protein WCX29_00480 [Candidatus Peribacteraceae bacterium]